MISLKRDNSNNAEFRKLILLLDQDLGGRYGKEQEVYDSHNVIEFIETVVVAYYDNQPAGCGCFKKYDDNTVEIKRMFVKPEFRGKGISKLVLKELENWGAQLGYSKSVLETGKKQLEAIGLYTKYGYNLIDNYGPYVGMPNSVCMQKNL